MNNIKKFGEFLGENKMTPSELKREIRKNFEATPANISKLVEDTKDYSTEEQISIAYSLGVTACGLYCAEMEKKYNKRIPI